MITPAKILLLPLMAATLIALAGCSTTSDGDRTAGRIIDDKIVTERVKDALEDSPVFKFDRVQVATYRGVVQLSGWAANEEQRARAGEIASNVQGVQDVVNNISVMQTERGETEASSRRTSGQTRSPTYPSY